MKRLDVARLLVVLCGTAACSSGNEVQPPPVETDSGSDVATCTTGTSSCGGACVDVAKSHDHCGACGNVCGAAEACVSGKCSTSCPSGQEVCEGACVTTATDNAHCGACGTKCAAGMVCSKGACATSCASDLATCPGDGDAGGGRCANLQTDNENCGGCGTKCAAGSSCSMGKCTTSCGTGLSVCGDADAGAEFCANLKTDNANCGACGTVCGAGTVCSDGTCATTCGTGLATCGGDGGAKYCARLESDLANCGACGTACASSESCLGGKCVSLCSGGKTACLATGTLYCADLASDHEDCGACGTKCAVYELCSSSSCKSPDLNVTTNTNLSTTNVTGRTCADGGDMVAYSVTELTGTTAKLSSAISAGCVGAGDEIMLINLQGTSTASANVGNYEVLKVASISGDTVTFASAKTKSYGDGATDDTNLGTARTNQRVVLQRVAQYGNVTVAAGTTLTATAWNGVKGGVFAFRATGAVKIDGAVSMKGAGYVGGARTTTVDTTGTQGESIAGIGASAQTVNAGGGGGGRGDNTGCTTLGAAGGGGANAIAGYAAQHTCGGTSGGAYGSTSKLTLGSGGGAGGTDNTLINNPPGGAGGAGGGIVWIAAPSTTVAGSMTAAGNDGEGDAAGVECVGAAFTINCWDYSGPGGGGGGGSIKIDSTTIAGAEKLDILGGNAGNGGKGAAGDGGSGGRGYLVGPMAKYTSCKELKAADSTATDGVYLLASDSSGSTPFPAYCDMTQDGGGWTLILDTNKFGPDQLVQNLGVSTNTARSMPLVEMKKFATAATQIHIRTTGDATRSVTSTADTTPILNLRNGIMMNAGTSSGTGSDWTGPFANTTNLSWSCSASGGGWPQTYQCCGTNGIHIWTLHSRWNWSGGNTSLNEPMQVYVR